MVANLKLLGSKCFREVHAGKAQNIRTKTYMTRQRSSLKRNQLCSCLLHRMEVMRNRPVLATLWMTVMWSNGLKKLIPTLFQFEENFLDTLPADPDMAGRMNLEAQRP